MHGTSAAQDPSRTCCGASTRRLSLSKHLAGSKQHPRGTAAVMLLLRYVYEYEYIVVSADDSIKRPFGY